MSTARKKVAIGYEDESSPRVEVLPSSFVRTADEIAVPLKEVAIFPHPSDNCVIAIKSLPARLKVRFDVDGSEIVLPHTVLEGHRFAVCDIPKGGKLTSWGLGFGLATRDIRRGDYCCNDSILAALRERNVVAELPATGCFENFCEPLPNRDRERNYRINIASDARSGDGLPGFMGFLRSAGRGVGTRNFVVILGTSVSVAAHARRIERNFRGVGRAGSALDGVVAIAHTEGSDKSSLNSEKVLRCLAGYLVHPNVSASLVLQPDGCAFKQYVESMEGLPGFKDTLVRWLTTSGDFDADVKLGTSIVEDLLPQAQAAERSWQCAKHLVVAQQCGGSDAFSGVTGNPLSGVCVKKLIACGGIGVLAETDELIGAEGYILEKVRNRDVEDKFLEFNARYLDYAARHGHSAEGQPSGGNKFRGLYNIALKSAGAAMKKPREVWLDGCLEYGERVNDPAGGYYFMDSPGNDLESIAGQVASGCNLIHFITGNGSITNFPFVPTIKIITTTNRWNLLSKDMDFNAGRLQEGESFDSLTEELFQMTLRVAGGERSVGEMAGLWQVSIWRDWLLPAGSSPEQLRALEQGERLGVGPLTPKAGNTLEAGMKHRWLGFAADDSGRRSARAVAMVLPTSICSGQVALKIAEELRPVVHAVGLDDIVALPHTEGCGTSSSELQDSIFRDVMVGHLFHPSVKWAVLLEHGCEKTHNDWFAQRLREMGKDIGSLEQASIQMDGGIMNVTSKIKRLLKTASKNLAGSASRSPASVRDLRIGIVTDHHIPHPHSAAVAGLGSEILRSGGTVVIPQGNELLSNAEFLDEVLEGGPEALKPNLAFAASVFKPGLHIMACPPRSSKQEQITGLAATGVDLIVAAVKAVPIAGSPLVPVMQVRCQSFSATKGNDGGFDVLLDSITDRGEGCERLWEVMLQIVSGTRRPQLLGAIGEGHVDFIVPRGATGISL